MNRFKTFLLALAAIGWLAPSGLAAPDKDKDKDKGNRPQQTNTASQRGGDVGDCSTGTAQVDLDANNVRARMFNTGQLFFNGGNGEYEVPRGSGLVSVFASGIWVGGQVDGELRMAAATYAQGSGYEFWPGPLAADGSAPTRESCQEFDRFWKITQDDINQYLDSGTTTADLLSWPVEFGAPVLNRTANGFDDDGDGLIDEGVDGEDNDGDLKIDERDEQEDVDVDVRRAANRPIYDLADGDLPDIIGTQSVWWIMNDRGNEHLETQAPPVGLEVTVQAFAFATSNAINNTTFYKYNLRYKGTAPLTQAYLGLWSDPDLGDYTDDFVGSDTELGLGFVYNGDDDDGTSTGYGARPPALGYDYFQGPLVNDDDIDNDGDGEVDEEDERIALSAFVYYNNDTSNLGNPAGADEFYNYLRARQRDGQPITEGFDGTNPSRPETKIMFPGNPPEYWSEYDVNPDPGITTANTPADRRFLMSSGPFTIQPGSEQEIVFGIVWSQASAGGALASVAKLKNDDALAQGAFDNDFEVPSPPDAPIVSTQPIDRGVVLTWSNPRTSNNFLNTYDVFNPFSDPSADDRTYTLEGYEVYQLDSPAQSIDQGTRLAVLDRVNGVTTITDQTTDPATGATLTEVVANGTDSGLRNSYTVRGLVNSQTYFFAVRAYAYNEASPTERVYASPVLFGTNLVSAIPSRQGSVAGGTVFPSQSGGDLPATLMSGDERATFTATVANPAEITGDTYEIRFRNLTVDNNDDDDTQRTVLIYDVVNTTTNQTVFNGEDFFGRTGVTPISNRLDGSGEFVTNDQVPIIDGFQLSVEGRTAADLPLYAEGCAELEPISNLIDTGRGRPMQRVVFERTSGSADAPPQGAVIRFNNTASGAPLLNFPEFSPAFDFVEVIGPGGADVCSSGNQQGCDQSDGVWVYAPGRTFARDIPASLNNGTNSTGEYHLTSLGGGPDENFGTFAPNEYEIRLTGRSYVYHLFTDTPNHPGYAVPYEVWDIGTTPNDPSDDVKMIPIIFADGITTDADACTSYNYRDDRASNLAGLPVTHRIYAYYPTETYEEWEAAVEERVLPIYTDETVIRINTADFAAVRGDDETQLTSLDDIAAVPNPYRGSSEYETDSNSRQIRFVNLPSSATIRIFTISGTLVREIVKPASTGTVAFWDLENQRGLPVASGMYLVHIEARGPDGNEIGERVLKLGVVQRRASIDIL